MNDASKEKKPSKGKALQMTEIKPYKQCKRDYIHHIYWDDDGGNCPACRDEIEARKKLSIAKSNAKLP